MEYFMRYESYTKVREIAVKYYKDANMCTVIALAVATGCGYGKAFHTYRRLGRRTGCGTWLPMQKDAFAAHGLMLQRVPAEAATLCTAERLLKHSQGTFLVYSRGHVSAVHNGTMYDWAAGGSRKRVTAIFKIIPKA
jgi:hypothetical protein